MMLQYNISNEAENFVFTVISSMLNMFMELVVQKMCYSEILKSPNMYEFKEYQLLSLPGRGVLWNRIFDPFYGVQFLQVDTLFFYK